MRTSLSLLILSVLAAGTAAAQVPTKPTSFRATGGDTQVTLEATTTGTVTKWQYAQGTSANFMRSWMDISSTSTSLSYTVTGLTNEVIYYFRVRAVNSNGPGPESHQAVMITFAPCPPPCWGPGDGTTPTNPTTPPTPTNPTTPTTPGNTGGSTQGLYFRISGEGVTVRMSWEDLSYAKYRYRWKEGFATAPGSFTPWQDIPDSGPGGGNSTSYAVAIPELECGKFYTFRFEGVNADGTAGSSSSATAVIIRCESTRSGVYADGTAGSSGSGTLLIQDAGNVPTSAESVELPAAVTLSQNYPNPFNPSTTIAYELPKGQHVRLAVYDMHGREVAELVGGFRSAGRHTVRFDGRELPSGAYVYRLITPGAMHQDIMVLAK